MTSKTKPSRVGSWLQRLVRNLWPYGWIGRAHYDSHRESITWTSGIFWTQEQAQQWCLRQTRADAYGVDMLATRWHMSTEPIRYEGPDIDAPPSGLMLAVK